MLLEQKWNVVREQDPDYGTVINYADYTGWVKGPVYVGAFVEARTAGNAKVTCVGKMTR